MRPISGPTPAAVLHCGEFVTVLRAWPTTKTTAEGALRLTVEGRDVAGRVRAAELIIARAGPGEWNAAGLSLAPPGRDRKLSDLASTSAAGEVVVHRYGRRAVVRQHGRYVKVLRRGRGEAAADQAERGAVMAWAAGFRAPQVLSAGQSRVECSVLPGTGLYELGGRTGLDQWRAWWGEWARRWPDLVGGDGAGLTAHTAYDEQENLRRWTTRTALFHALPDPDGAFADRATAVCLALGDGVGRPLGVSHRDLHDKQVLAGEHGLGLLDFDTAALAEPALDLANLMVHAELRADQGLWSAAHRDVAAGSVHQVAAELSVPVDRLAVYAEATRLRLACLYSFRPRHRDLALAWAFTRGAADEKTLISLSSATQTARGDLAT